MRWNATRTCVIPITTMFVITNDLHVGIRHDIKRHDNSFMALNYGLDMGEVIIKIHTWNVSWKGTIWKPSPSRYGNLWLESWNICRLMILTTSHNESYLPQHRPPKFQKWQMSHQHSCKNGLTFNGLHKMRNWQKNRHLWRMIWSS